MAYGKYKYIDCVLSNVHITILHSIYLYNIITSYQSTKRLASTISSIISSSPRAQYQILLNGIYVIQRVDPIFLGLQQGNTKAYLMLGEYCILYLALTYSLLHSLHTMCMRWCTCLFHLSFVVNCAYSISLLPFFLCGFVYLAV